MNWVVWQTQTSAHEFVKQKKGKLNYGSLHTVWYIVNHIVQAKRTEAVWGKKG